MPFFIKTVFDKDIRRFTLDQPVFAELESKLQTMYSKPGVSFQVKYDDEDGDAISVSSNVELEEAVKCVKENKSLTLRVCPTSEANSSSSSSSHTISTPTNSALEREENIVSTSASPSLTPAASPSHDQKDQASDGEMVSVPSSPSLAPLDTADWNICGQEEGEETEVLTENKSEVVPPSPTLGFLTESEPQTKSVKKDKKKKEKSSQKKKEKKEKSIKKEKKSIKKEGSQKKDSQKKKEKKSSEDKKKHSMKKQQKEERQALKKALKESRKLAKETQKREEREWAQRNVMYLPFATPRSFFTSSISSPSSSPPVVVSNTNQTVHNRVRCDGCDMFPLIGDRYKCETCYDFDLCSTCEAKPSSHPQSHPLIKFKRPEIVEHMGVKCDGCGVYPIAGDRFKCMVCPQFDLCVNCEEKRLHEPSHPLVKLRVELRSLSKPLIKAVRVADAAEMRAKEKEILKAEDAKKDSGEQKELESEKAAKVAKKAAKRAEKAACQEARKQKKALKKEWKAKKYDEEQEELNMAIEVSLKTPSPKSEQLPSPSQSAVPSQEQPQVQSPTVAASSIVEEVKPISPPSTPAPALEVKEQASPVNLSQVENGSPSSVVASPLERQISPIPEAKPVEVPMAVPVACPSIPLALPVASPVQPVALAPEMEAKVQILNSMGFTDRPHTCMLLNRFDGDLQRVVEALLHV